MATLTQVDPALVPTFTSLDSVYSLNVPTSRYERLTAAFKQRFGDSPSLIARAPGRVNLIGEHIDYEGYGVLPMAVDLDTIVAIRKGGDKLVVANLEDEKYPVKELSIDPDQAVDVSNHHWTNYFLAAYKGVFEFAASKGSPITPTGLQVVVHGTVPFGSGLSSSSALVCAVSLAVMGAHNVTGTKSEVAEFTCLCERYVGLQSGGMDQAISMMAKAGFAQLIEFNPVRGTDVILPEGATFVIANCLAVSKKAETAAGRYNLRVVECRLAAAVLAVALGVSQKEAQGIRTLRDVEPLIADEVGPGKQLDAVQQHLHEGRYTEEEVSSILGITLTELLGNFPSSLQSLPVAASLGGFKLRDRALHVYAEAQRVHDFKDVCLDAQLSQQDKLKKLGELMDASQTSCCELYECSCEELDELTALCRSKGALGSRLTGAGWGGCTVSLVPDNQVPSFIKAVTDEYFVKRIQSGVITKDELGAVIFASKPSSGGAYLHI